jgi:hypothetical protein
MWSPLLGFVIGALTVAIGNHVAHRYSLQREQRADFAAVLDRTVQSFVGGDRAVSGFIAQVGTGKPAGAVQAAADRVSDHEVEMRAALFSLRLRLPPDHRLAEAFSEAHGAFTASYLATEPAIKGGEVGTDAVAGALETHQEFRMRFDAAMDCAGDTLSDGTYRR